MPRLSKSWDDVSTSMVLPDGKYHAQVSKVTYGTSKAGNEMHTFEFEVTEPGYEGRTVRAWIAYTADNLPAAKRKLLGICGSDEALAVFNDWDSDTEMCPVIGNPVILDLGSSKGEQGGEFQDVKSIMPDLDFAVAASASVPTPPTRARRGGSGYQYGDAEE